MKLHRTSLYRAILAAFLIVAMFSPALTARAAAPNTWTDNACRAAGRWSTPSRLTPTSPAACTLAVGSR